MKEMPYKESYRRFLMRVTKGKCVADIYTERAGFKECKAKAVHVHHPIAEGFLLEQGEDPEHFAPGVPLCKNHHVGRSEDGNEEYGKRFTFHPDAGEAYHQYRNWKETEAGMKHTIGFCDIPSPFKVMEQHHQCKAKKGERYWAGTPELDQHLINKMNEKIQRHVILFPNDKTPERKQHPYTDRKKKKRWYDGLF